MGNVGSNDYDKILLRPHPRIAVLYEAQSDDQISVDYPPLAADDRLRMLKNQLDTDRLLIVVLVLVDWGVVPILVCTWQNVVSNADVGPFETITEFPMLWRYRN